MGRFRGFEVISPAHLPPKVHSSAVVSLFHYFLHTLVDLCGSSHLRVNSPHPQLRHFFFLFSLSLFLSLSLFFFIFLPFWNSSSVPLYCPRPMKHFPVWESFNHFFFCRPAFMFSVCCHLIYSYVKKNNVGLPIYDIHKAIRLNYTIWIESSICGKKNRHSFESNFGWFQYETDLPSRLCDLPS